MKALKKISLVYTLQIFAVILIFGYTDSSSGGETKKIIPNSTSTIEMSKNSTIKTAHDFSLKGQENLSWIAYFRLNNGY